jgi:hypothetical protein
VPSPATRRRLPSLYKTATSPLIAADHLHYHQSATYLPPIIESNSSRLRLFISSIPKITAASHPFSFLSISSTYVFFFLFLLRFQSFFSSAGVSLFSPHCHTSPTSYLLIEQPTHHLRFNPFSLDFTTRLLVYVYSCRGQLRISHYNTCDIVCVCEFAEI